MTRTFKWSAALCLAALSTVPAFAGGATPLGSWEITTGESRYEVTACGKNGNLLCAKLVWLAPDQRSEDNLSLLNTYVVKGAQPTEENVWSGNVVFEGHSYDGTVKLVSKNYMTLRGCSGILCQTYEFTRI